MEYMSNNNTSCKQYCKERKKDEKKNVALL